VRTSFVSRWTLLTLCIILAGALSACGGSGSPASSTSSPPAEDPGRPAPNPGDPAACDGVEFDSTFDAVQKVVFDSYGCTNSGCHGNGTTSGGLDLSPGASWDNLHEVSSTVSSDQRVVPGAPFRSVLYQKLAGATLGEPTPGSPMPIGLPPLSESDLNLLRWWIYGGAPRDGVVLEAVEYTPGCLPEPEPLTISPLEPPAPGEGIQLVMPEFELDAGLEVERCFASYYDVCDQVPADVATTIPGLGDAFVFDARELRMDPGSHHLILNYSVVPPDMLEDPSFGEWVCAGGETAGSSCDPTDLSSCGSGSCRSRIREGFTYGGFGPSLPGSPVTFFPIGGAQRPQDLRQYPEGVFNPLPCRGVLYWNPHAFNLTSKDRTNHARLNYYFADPDNLLFNNRGGLMGVNKIFIANNPPFTKETFCNDLTFPQGTRIFTLSSHTHKHGEHFWVEAPDGTMVYENFEYNDPRETVYDPPLAFDSPDDADRTLRYCATYNNGVKPDGSPDVELVTRASRVPASARVAGSFGTCRPTACVNEGMVGGPCDGEDDDAACDTSPGAGDGFCDACRITGGESTENEMFLLISEYFVVPVG